MARQYDAVVANPPYMGSKFYSTTLKTLVNREFKEAKADLYSCFMQRNAAAAKSNGFVGMITIPNWMFLSSFEEMRKSLFDHQTIDTFVHNGRGVFGSDFRKLRLCFRNANLPAYRAAIGDYSTNKAVSPAMKNLKTIPFVPDVTPNDRDFKRFPGAPWRIGLAAASRSF